MGHKVFISYKYADTNVAPLYPAYLWGQTTVRSYVDAFMEKVKAAGIAVYKGEMEGEDLSHLSDAGIWEKLKTKIYDSSVTVVFISPGMRVHWKEDDDQWIPWEISYSLREETRQNRTSGTNALLLVVLPDQFGHYAYVNNMRLFDIISGNIKNGYAEVVQWNIFMSNISYYIERAIQRKGRIAANQVVKSV